MKQQRFEECCHEDCQQFEHMLAAMEGTAGSSDDISQFPGHYRRMCHYLSLARERQYSAHLVDKLNNLVLRGHQQLYRRKVHLLHSMIRFVVADFPAIVRQQWRYCLIAAALFYLPGAILCAFTLLFPELVYSIASAESVIELESMYDPAAAHIGRFRDADSDFAMFGFYIQNNIGIGFRTFAGGILFGIGSLFFLLYNGLIFGAFSAHIINLDFGSTFFSFVVGHAAFELTAIVLSGAAGLKLGFAMIAPGRYPRWQAVKNAAGTAIKIIYGVILMLLIAAFIEAFWSSSTLIQNELKYIVGGCFWLFVFVYFGWMGRRNEA